MPAPLLRFLENRIFLILLIALVALLCVPMIIAASARPSQRETKTEPQITGSVSILVYIAEEDRTLSMELEEYVLRVVAAEMPANYELEALKAQACAARTFAVKKMQGAGGHKDGAAVCTDSAHCQAYASPEDMKKNWGGDYASKHGRIRQAVTETQGRIIVYRGEPITALYHSTSGGYTENSEDVFVSAVPYLRSVKSDGEESFAPRFYGEVQLDEAEFASKLEEFSKSIDIPEKNVASSIGDIRRTETGRVRSVAIGNQTLTGRQMRSLFHLNSTNFKIRCENGSVVFETVGYGHGVGMSQTGANAMAKKGARYDEILKYYYTGVDIVSMDAKA